MVYQVYYWKWYTFRRKTITSSSVAKGSTGLTSLGTAGQALKVNSGANGLEFGTISSDFVKIASNIFKCCRTSDLDGTSVWGDATCSISYQSSIFLFKISFFWRFLCRQLESGALNSNNYSSMCLGQTQQLFLFR